MSDTFSNMLDFASGVQSPQVQYNPIAAASNLSGPGNGQALANMGLEGLAASGLRGAHGELLYPGAAGVAQGILSGGQRTAQQQGTGLALERENLANLAQRMMLPLQIAKARLGIQQMQALGNEEGFSQPAQPPAQPPSQAEGAPVSPTYGSLVHNFEGNGENKLWPAAYGGPVGPHQFSADTWGAIVKAHPQLFGVGQRSMLQIMQLRNDPRISDMATRLYAQDNAPILQQAGIPTDDVHLAAAHFLGPAGLRAAWQAPNSPLGNVLKAQIPGFSRANPSWADKSLNQLLETYQRINNSLNPLPGSPTYMQPPGGGTNNVTAPVGATPNPITGNITPEQAEATARHFRGMSVAAATAGLPSKQYEDAATSYLNLATKLREIGATPQIVRPGSIQYVNQQPVASAPLAAKGIGPNGQEISFLQNPTTGETVAGSQHDVGLPPSDAEALRTMGRNAANAYNDPEEIDAYNHASNGLLYGSRILSGLEELNRNPNFLQTGAGAEFRMGLANILNTYSTMFGGNMQIDPSQLGTAQEINKLTTQLATQTTEGMKGRQPGFVLQMIRGATPGLEQSPMGAKMLTYGIMEDFQRIKDRHDYMSNLIESGNTKQLATADTDFQRKMPVRAYFDRLKSQVTPLQVPADRSKVDLTRFLPGTKLAPEGVMGANGQQRVVEVPEGKGIEGAHLPDYVRPPSQ